MRVRFSPWTFLLSRLVLAPPWYGGWSDSISLGSFLEERWSNGKIPVLGTGEKGSIPLRSPHFDDGGDDITISADFYFAPMAGASSSLVRRMEWFDSTWELQGLWSNGKTPCSDHGNKGSTPFNPLGRLHSFFTCQLRRGEPRIALCMVHWLRRYESEAYKIRFDSGDKGISDSTLDLRAGMVGRVKRPLLSLGDLVQRKNTSSATKRRGIVTPNLHLRNHQQTMTTDKIYEARSFSLVLFFFFFFFFFFFCLLSVLFGAVG